MNQQKKLLKYCDTLLLQVTFEDQKMTFENKVYEIVDEDATLFDQELNFIPIMEDEMSDGFVYEFCGHWYIQHYEQKFEFTPLRYKGKAKQKLPNNHFLGIHSGYELMNGMGLYKDWIKKAKFLGIQTLAIVEKHTLAGALEFQSECKKNKIKSIFGMTVSVSNNGNVGEMKIYVKDFEGWSNLLKINSIINVDKSSFIDGRFLSENCEGLFLVSDPKYTAFEDVLSCVNLYQLDTVEFSNKEQDEWYLQNLEKYIHSELSPVSICDAYFLEQSEFLIREDLWKVSKSFDHKTTNQYFKNKDQYAVELISMFEKGFNGWNHLFKIATENEAMIADQCNFSYDTDTRHLPKYVMTKEQSENFSDNKLLFLDLIKKGFREKNIKDQKKYLDRLKAEITVLEMGDVIDYFLSLHDIIEFAKRENMLTGIGRGSAGGSLVAYLLGIIQIDPLEFDLLFERFLNSGRMGEYQERPAYDIIMEDGSKIQLAEGSLVRVLRNEKEKVIFIDDLVEGDEIIKI